MTDLLHQLIFSAASAAPDGECLVAKSIRADYATVARDVERFAGGLAALRIAQQDRVAVFLPKTIEMVVSLFGCHAARGIAVPINPVLKPQQVGHILRDSGARVLVTNTQRLKILLDELRDTPEIRHVIVTDDDPLPTPEAGGARAIVRWSELRATGSATLPRVIDTDIATLLYTSGSTGKPKGVVLSHRNMVAGAKSVASYLDNRPEDRILALLPLSFDAGFSQLTTAFHSGATAVLHDYFLPRDTLRLAEKERITGITAVPPLWMQLAELDWPETTRTGLRYFANTGGKMPRPLLASLRSHFPNAAPYLMYGLTEAFRSTYLPPEHVDTRPDSIGMAIPNAEILVVNAEGKACAANEPGELVHRGALVAQGYWNDPEKTRQRFRPAPGRCAEVQIEELAVWSGDIVTRDDDGFLYFVGRNDDMIKSSGYRISPTELEETLYQSGLVSEAAAFGIEAGALGHTITIIVSASDTAAPDTDALLNYCRKAMPTYMIPHEIVWRASLPRTPNGKIDRTSLAAELAESREQ